MYPWLHGDWKQRGPKEMKTVFKLPRKDGGWGIWKMGPGKRGLETMVLLCRDDPLPEGEDLKVKEMLGRFGRCRWRARISERWHGSRTARWSATSRCARRH
jgi:hypothetical protein